MQNRRSLLRVMVGFLEEEVAQKEQRRGLGWLLPISR
jgi:hypothetical protein